MGAVLSPDSMAFSLFDLLKHDRFICDMTLFAHDTCTCINGIEVPLLLLFLLMRLIFFRRINSRAWMSHDVLSFSLLAITLILSVLFVLFTLARIRLFW